MAVANEIIVSHVTGAEHPAGVDTFEGVTSCAFAPSTKSLVLADGERTQEADVIGCRGTLVFRNLKDATTFLTNPKKDLRVFGMVLGQSGRVQFDFPNCKAQGWGNLATFAGPPDPYAIASVDFQADSFAITELGE